MVFPAKSAVIRAAYAAVLGVAFGLLPGGARAQVARVTPEGRTALPVPVSANVTQIASDGDSSGVVYEPQRIKRTVPLDPAGGLAGKWDVLYSIGDSGNNSAGARTTYFDWDEQFLYFAVETPMPMREARFDLDCANDGWLKGADNLSIFVTPPAEGANATPKVTAQRFDLVQNKDAPVWAASPLAPSDIEVKSGKTPGGGYAIVIALRRTETVGVPRKPGSQIGVRIDAGNLAAYQGETVLIPVRPLLRLTLADHVSASDGPVIVSVDTGKTEILPSGELKATVEVKNTGSAPVRLTRLFLRGAGGASADLLDDQKFAGADVAPGKSIKRDLKSNLPPAAPMGTFVLSGGADVDGTGKTLSALVAFDQIEPYSVQVETDDKPIPAGSTAGVQTVREVRVLIKNKGAAKTTAQVKLTLPPNWTLEKNAPTEAGVGLSYAGETRIATFHVVIPPQADPGRHMVSAQVTVGGRTYTGSASFLILH